MNKVQKKHLRAALGRIPFARRLYRCLRRGRIKEDSFDSSSFVPLNGDLSLDGAFKVVMDWPENIRKPYVGLVRECSESTAYWPKYERFLKNNGIRYDFYEVHRSDWLEAAQSFDIIIWRTMHRPSEQEEACSKLWILEKELNKLCIPSFQELWFYENKINQYYLCKTRGIPAVNTFISNSREEALEHIANCAYPFVSKITTGAGSQGVRLVRSCRAAKKICGRVFDDGLYTYWPYIKQKDYVYFQDYLPEAEYDLRVIIAGSSYFGYYRWAPKGDFRASGADLADLRTAIPEEALLTAKRIKDSYPRSRMLAVDMLRDKRDGKFYFLEVSIFFQVDIPSELTVDGILGRYTYVDGHFVFEPCKYWVQELVMLELMKEWTVLEGGK